MSKPILSVILPVYNCEAYIEECVESVLNQSFTDFELLVFNDGSTDNTLNKIMSFTDSRIIIHNKANNVGYVTHLNEGISLAKGEFIVRMDADDICVLNRFEILYNFMVKHPKIGVCGSFVEVFGNSRNYLWKLPTENNSIKAMLPFRIPFIHPSVIIRKSLLNNSIFYDNNFLPAEDYELWCRLSNLTEFANIPIALIKYRQHEKQISREKKQYNKRILIR